MNTSPTLLDGVDSIASGLSKSCGSQSVDRVVVMLEGKEILMRRLAQDSSQGRFWQSDDMRYSLAIMDTGVRVQAIASDALCNRLGFALADESYMKAHDPKFLFAFYEILEGDIDGRKVAPYIKKKAEEVQ